jgi:hypothetical protein
VASLLVAVVVLVVVLWEVASVAIVLAMDLITLRVTAGWAKFEWNDI